MSIEIMTIAPSVIAELNDRLLLPDGRIRLLPSAFYSSIPRDHLRAWCNRTARYIIPTVELIDWLKEQIGDREAIEVGSGNGDLGYHLGIPETDSYCQTLPEVKFFYLSTGQAPTTPSKAVKKLDVKKAIKHYRPKAVVASWLTRKFIEGRDVVGRAQASHYGPVEEDIIRKCDYIHIGNWNVHSEKTILSIPYEEYRFPWIVSRSADPAKDMILVWKRGSHG